MMQITGGDLTGECAIIVILIPGAWHGAWCWERVAPLLERQGCAVLTPDLPSHSPTGQATLETWAHSVAELAASRPGRVMLVGHSRGGAVISQAAEYVVDRVAALVYVSGMLLVHGESVLGFGADKGMSTALAAAIVPDADGNTLRVRTDSLKAAFYNTTAQPWIDRAASMVHEEPTAPNATALQLTDERFGRVPRYYVECLQDQILPPSLQRYMYERVPCRRVIALDTDHSPFYSAPDELAGALLSIAANLSPLGDAIA
jgi:pimeloyl-ACP methyl ester carboxylesterase